MKVIAAGPSCIMQVSNDSTQYQVLHTEDETTSIFRLGVLVCPPAPQPRFVSKHLIDLV
ncbi:hypothetical protein PAXRUDRAFT_825673 [Paxillus rubicundulus Ve08.2h10]|uniref:Uncharacterized protein n=1 Tax=Paxillus rubicundulus Ve08.2h10 TaxID=930991 RepID=A0A0D0E0B2_9AGAM|nr:hypothetical protein PAXRUDRAFT_825673 [Paxillus rubicundulus Ve08.2h10]